QAMHGLDGRRPVGAPADLEPTLDEAVPVGGGGPEHPHRVGVRSGRAIAIADPSRELHRLWSEAGDHDRRWRLRQVVHAAMLHAVVPATVVVHAAPPE